MEVDVLAALQAEPAEPRWIVKDMFPRSQLVLLAGEPGVGKSVLSYRLAFCAALGLPFLGFPTEQTRVLYFDEENGYQEFLRYLQWTWHGMGCPAIEHLPEWLKVHHFSLTTGWKEVMRDAVHDFKPGLMIVDTATPAFHILEENDNSEAARIVHELRKLQAGTQAGTQMTTVLLKHERQREDTAHRRTIRGAKGWLGMADAVLYHARLPGRPKKDGLRASVLEPDKLRAYGLRQNVKILPSWTDASRKGLILNGEIVIEPDSSEA